MAKNQFFITTILCYVDFGFICSFEMEVKKTLEQISITNTPRRNIRRVKSSMRFLFLHFATINDGDKSSTFCGFRRRDN